MGKRKQMGASRVRDLSDGGVARTTHAQLGDVELVRRSKHAGQRQRPKGKGKRKGRR